MISEDSFFSNIKHGDQQRSSTPEASECTDMSRSKSDDSGEELESPTHATESRVSSHKVNKEHVSKNRPSTSKTTDRNLAKSRAKPKYKLRGHCRTSSKEGPSKRGGREAEVVGPLSKRSRTGNEITNEKRNQHGNSLTKASNGATSNSLEGLTKQFEQNYFSMLKFDWRFLLRHDCANTAATKRRHLW